MAQCDELDVRVIYNPGEEPNSTQRMTWLEEIYADFPNVTIGRFKNTPGKEEDSRWWAESVLAMELGNGYPDAFFTSEPYGITWAQEATKLIGRYVESVQVDVARSSTPISGTLVRSDPIKYWSYIPTQTREHYAKKFCIIGGESTGKSTMTKNIAWMLGGTYTLEAGRDFVEVYGMEKDNRAIWPYIMREQPWREQQAARNSNGIVICDTDLMTTGVWYDEWVGRDDWFNDNLGIMIADQIGRYEHHFLLDHEGVPWVDDGTRSEWNRRAAFSQKLEDECRYYEIPYTKIGGSFQERGITVINMIKEMLQ